MSTKLLARKTRAKRVPRRKPSREDRLEALPPTELRRRLDSSLSRLADIIKRPR